MSNNLAAVAPRILAQGLLALRGATVMPRIVNTRYDSLAGQKGSTIDVPIPSAIAAQAVTAANTPPSTADSTPSFVPVPLDQWYEAPFYLTDQDQFLAVEGVVPMQVSEAIKALAENVNGYLMGLYKQVPNYVGAATTTPFGSSLAEATDARKLLQKRKAPPGDRRMVIDVDAEAKVLSLAQFTSAQWEPGNSRGLIEGSMGRRMGFDWFADQQVPTHTTTAFTAGAVTVNGVNALNAGSTDGGRTGTVSIAKLTNSAPLVVGDIITINGDPQTYAVTANTTLIVGNTTVPITPALRKATVGAESVTLLGSHVANLAFHRDAFAFGTRPLESSAQGLGNIIQSAVDPVSGLSLRLEISREHKRTRWSFDILYGGILVRPDLAVRVAG